MSNSPSDIDEKLIYRIQSGDTLALNQLVKRWHQSFCQKAYWMVKDKDVAKDIAQDSWTTIITKMDALRDPKSFKYWAYRIVCNKSTDWLRQQSKNIKKTAQYPKQVLAESIEEKSEVEQLKKTLSITINALPEHHRTVIHLFYVNDYSLKEISALLNISVGTAKSRLFHAREKLKNTLKNKYYEN